MKHLLIATLGMLVVSCSISHRDIAYGTDVCHYCKMTIVDRSYGAEIVTQKGKVFVFDAIECMMHQLREPQQAEPGLILVNSPAAPGHLMPAEFCTYLISKKMPSPMGANLTAFQNQEQADEAQRNAGGIVYDWHALNQEFPKISGRPYASQPTSPNTIQSR